jgi:hypothetical protein
MGKESRARQERLAVLNDAPVPVSALTQTELARAIAVRNVAGAKAVPLPRMIFGLTRKQKTISFKLSYASAMADSLKRDEVEGSRLWVKLDNLEQHILRVLDEYRLQLFHGTDLDKASALYEILDAEIAKMYP